jgi:hypothetical protein
MVAGTDGMIYFSSAVTTTPRFYQYDRTRAWNPGPASDPDFNPKFWIYQDQNREIERYRSTAVDSSDSGPVYIGTGSAGDVYRAHLLVFDPNKVVRSRFSNALSRTDSRPQRPSLVVSPNPFHDRAEIAYDAMGHDSGCGADFLLAIYDAAGRLVKSFEGLENQSGVLSWDGRNQSGATVTTGIYLCTITSGGFSETRKIVFLR